MNQETEAVKEIVEFWNSNGFGITNVHAKQQLLSRLDDSSFLQPKDMILKAMRIACENNNRKLNYVMGIMRKWEKESFLTVEDTILYGENQKQVLRPKQSTEPVTTGRDIPREFVFDITAGEDW